MGKLTNRQTQYRAAMEKFFNAEDQFPPTKTLAGLMGTTNNAAGEMLIKLEQAAVITRNKANKFKRGSNW